MKTKKLSRLFPRDLTREFTGYNPFYIRNSHAQNDATPELKRNLSGACGQTSSGTGAALVLINQGANILLVLFATLLTAAFILELLRRQDRRSLARPQFLFLDR